MADIVFISLEGDYDQFGERIKGKEHAQFAEQLTSEFGEGFATDLMNRMKAMLAKGHKYNVGASGAASENLSVKRESSGVGRSSWVIVEGNKTVSNYYIRSGFRGSSKKVNGVPVGPPIANIRLWIAEKGSSHFWSTTDRKYSFVKQRSRSGKWYGRRLKKSRDTDDMLYRIQRKLAWLGSAYGNWESLYPKGSGRFDYVQWAIKQSHPVDKLFAAGWLISRAYVDFLLSGRKLRGEFGQRTFNAPQALE